PVKWSVFGLSSIASAKEDGSHTQTTIFSSSTIFFQPNFAGLLKLPQLIKIADRAQKKPENISVFRLELSLKQL
ncbi:MAG: hypothetical protein IJW23_07195, partial [Lentisphaeria bacterium]|nr:hypothetical protein [Lentisphaeria bacterium]